MDIERLKELKSWVGDLRKFGVSEGNEIIVLIDEAIARQSVKSEEVQEAIALLEVLREKATDNPFLIHRNVVRLYDLAITALQAYQPTTRKDRTVEEVAISKTATTSCENRKTKTEKKYDDFRSYNAQGDCYKYVCSCNNCGQVLWEVADYNYGQGEKGHTPNYCPNCGRRLD